MRRILLCLIAATALTLAVSDVSADAVSISQIGNGNIIGNQNNAQPASAPFSENLAIAIVAAMGAVAAASVPFIVRKKRSRRRRTASDAKGATKPGRSEV
jgi:beta-lactamase regulating signal transducer with metallopeptidase domain